MCLKFPQYPILLVRQENQQASEKLYKSIPLRELLRIATGASEQRRMDGRFGIAKRSPSFSPCSGKTQIELIEAWNTKAKSSCQGGPDLLAALGYFPTCGVVCMPSANTDFCPLARRELAKRNVVIIPHADEVGRKALQRWVQQLGVHANGEW